VCDVVVLFSIVESLLVVNRFILLVFDMKSQNLSDFEEKLQTQTGQSHPLHQADVYVAIFQVSPFKCPENKHLIKNR
jgi:hypothetical protein